LICPTPKANIFLRAGLDSSKVSRRTDLPVGQQGALRVASHWGVNP
jgi:hypothetical protein